MLTRNMFQLVAILTSTTIILAAGVERITPKEERYDYRGDEKSSEPQPKLAVMGKDGKTHPADCSAPATDPIVGSMVSNNNGNGQYNADSYSKHTWRRAACECLMECVGAAKPYALKGEFISTNRDRCVGEQLLKQFSLSVKDLLSSKEVCATADWAKQAQEVKARLGDYYKKKQATEPVTDISQGTPLRNPLVRQIQN